MTLNFFSKPASDSNPKRARAVQTVRAWLWGKRHLPPDLIAALHVLAPELARDRPEVEDFPD